MRQRRGLMCLALVAVVGLAGCGKKAASNRPATVKATVLVLHKGQPVEGASVVLRPKAQGGQAAVATTDSSGKGALTTFESGDGALPGDYSAGVSKTKSDAKALSEEEEAALERKYRNKPAPPPKVMELLPAKYKDPAKSGLNVTINASGPEEVKLELQD